MNSITFKEDCGSDVYFVNNASLSEAGSNGFKLKRLFYCEGITLEREVLSFVKSLSEASGLKYECLVFSGKNERNQDCKELWMQAF